MAKLIEPLLLPLWRRSHTGKPRYRRVLPCPPGHRCRCGRPAEYSDRVTSAGKADKMCLWCVMHWHNLLHLPVCIRIKYCESTPETPPITHAN